MKLYIFFLSFGLSGFVLSSPASNNPEKEQIAAVFEAAAAAAAEAKAAAAAETAETAETPAQVNENKAASSSSSSAVSNGNSGASAAAAAAASKKKGKSGYGLMNGYGNTGAGYGTGSVQTVLNFYPQQNGTGYGNYNTSTPAPDVNATTPDYNQKPVNYVIYIQPQAVYGQNGQQKPNGYGQLNQNYQTGQTGLYGAVQNTGYGVANQNQYGLGNNLNNAGQYGALNTNSQYSGVNSAQLGYGIQANYLQNPQPVSYGGSSVVSGYPVNTGAYGNVAGTNTYNQQPYSTGVISSYSGNQATVLPVPNYGAQNQQVYPAGNPGYAQAVPVVAYPVAQPALTVGGYPTVPVSSYHGSASNSYPIRPQKPQSIYVSTYTQPQIYVKPGKPVSSSYGKPLSYLTASASTNVGYGKPAQVGLQATYSKPQVVSYSKPQVTTYNQSPEVYVAVDDDQSDYKKSKEHMKETSKEAKN